MRPFSLPRLPVSRILSPAKRMDDHLSWLDVATKLTRSNAGTRASNSCATSLPCSRRGLPPPGVTTGCCGLLPHSFHPYQLGWRFRFCGTFPRLGCRWFLERTTEHLLPVVVNNRPALCCPDFPLQKERSSSNLSDIIILNFADFST